MKQYISNGGGPTARSFNWIESGRAGLVTLSLGGPERSRKNEYSGGRLRYLDAAIEAAERFWCAN